MMLGFVHAESKRLKFSKKSRHRFACHQYGWRRQENIRPLIILIKLIYTTIFICFTISTYINQSTKCSRRIFDIWYSFLSVILLLSLFVDRIKRQNLLSLKLLNIIEIFLILSFIIFVILGHIEAYQRLLWSSSSIDSTLFCIILIDLCPISVAMTIIIDSFKKRRSWRRINVNNIISNV